MKKIKIIITIVIISLTSSCNNNESIFTLVKDKNPQTLEKALKSNPALVSTKNEQNWSPLQLALELQQKGKTNQNSWKPVIETLIKHDADINTKTEWGYSTLMYACNYGYYDLAQELLLKGADLEIQTNERKDKIVLEKNPGMNALMYSTYSNNIELTKLLLNNGAVVNNKDKFGSTALFHALHNQNEEIAFELIKNGAKTNLLRHKNQSLLILACANNLTNIVEHLLENNKELINICMRGNFSPLIIAVDNQSIESVELLLKSGADTEITDDNGDTAYSISLATGNKTIIDLLKKYMPKNKAENYK